MPEPHTSSTQPHSDPGSDEVVCRICRLEGSPEDPLLHPCKCSGSIRFIHEPCLKQWLTVSKRQHCEVTLLAFRESRSLFGKFFISYRIAPVNSCLAWLCGALHSSRSSTSRGTTHPAAFAWSHHKISACVQLPDRRQIADFLQAGNACQLYDCTMSGMDDAPLQVLLVACCIHLELFA